jgi:hypothetical protein
MKWVVKRRENGLLVRSVLDILYSRKGGLFPLLGGFQFHYHVPQKNQAEYLLNPDSTCETNNTAFNAKGVFNNK